MEHKQAVVYARVSTTEQGKGYSLQTQLISCQAYALERGYEILAEFSDQHTGTEIDRPGLNQLLQFVTGETVHVVIVHDLDRLSREPAYQAILEMELASSGVKIEYVLGQYEDSPEGDLTKMIKSAIAKYENRQRVERGRRGKQGRARAGYVITTGARAPYGYRYVSEPHKGWFVIDEAEAEVVRQIYAWILEGQTCYAIARTLHERHILTRGDLHEAVVKKAQPGAWSPSTIRRIIASETYKGTWYFGKTRRQKINGKTVQRKFPKSEWIAVDVPAIVDADTWQRAQEKLTVNRQQARRNARRKYLLRGLVFCRCGRRWTGRYKNHLKRAYYRCPKTEATRWMGFCDMPGGIRQEKLEDAVWHKVTEALLNPVNLRTELSLRRTEREARLEDKHKQITAVQEELTEVERKLGVLLDQVLVTGFPESVVQERKDILLARRKHLLTEVKRLQTETEPSYPTVDDEEGLIQFAEHIQDTLQYVDFDAKRRILELLQVRVDVVSQDTIKLSAMIPFRQESVTDLSVDQDVSSSDAHQSDGSIARISSG